MAEENGFPEYKLYITKTLDSHSEALKEIHSQLAAVSATLVEIKTQRATAKWLGGFVIPAGVALLASSLARKMGL